MNSVVFTRSRLRTLGFVLGAAMFIAVGYLLANDPELSLYRRAWGWICIAFFGAVFVSASWSFLRGGRMFTLDPSGITDHQRGVVIPWGEIQKVRVVNVQGARFLGLVFHQPAQFLERLSPLRRMFSEFSENHGWCYWNFTFAAVEPGIEKALEYIRENVPGVRVLK